MFQLVVLSRKGFRLINQIQFFFVEELAGVTGRRIRILA